MPKDKKSKQKEEKKKDEKKPDKKSSQKKKGPEEEKKDSGKLKTCTHVKARHILCEKLSRIQEAHDKLSSSFGSKPPLDEFGKIAMEYSECSSKKKGGDLGWFPRGKMVGAFQDIAFNTPEGQMSEIFKTQHGYHFLIVEGRKNGWTEISALNCLK